MVLIGRASGCGRGVQERVLVHKQVLKELERAVLCLCPKDLPLSSKAVRKQQVRMMTQQEP